VHTLVKTNRYIFSVLIFLKLSNQDNDEYTHTYTHTHTHIKTSLSGITSFLTSGLHFFFVIVIFFPHHFLTYIEWSGTRCLYSKSVLCQLFFLF